MSGQHKECIFTTPCTPKPTPKSPSMPIKITLTAATRPPKGIPSLFFKLKISILISFSIYVEVEKIEIEKSRPLSKHVCFEWYGWLIGHVSISVKNSVSDVKEKITNQKRLQLKIT